MKPIFQIAPLAFLLAGAAVTVWRGFDAPPDNTRVPRKKRKRWTFRK